MTDEEMVEWAKTYVQPTSTVTTPRSLARNKKSKARTKVNDNLRRAKDYRDPVKRLKWIDNDRRNRFLYNHNPEFKALKDYRNRMYQFKKRKYAYDAWIVKYYAQYKGKMGDKAQTFRLEDGENYVNGFTISELIKYSPIKKGLLQSLFTYNVLPEPKYIGYVFKAKSISDKPEAFYLVSEVEAYLNVLARYRKKFGGVSNDDQRAYLKKQFWTTMLKARKNFDGN